MYKKTFKLIQHTPIIHFQPNHIGAVLRASDVKPRLDRFVIEKLGGEKEVRKQHPQWFISNESSALDYKMRIDVKKDNIKQTSFIEEPKGTNDDGTYKSKTKNRDVTDTKSYPLFFGNMGLDYNKDEIKKFIFYPNEIDLIILSIDKTLGKTVEECLYDFFILNNFGSRKGKGFGSFTIEGTTEKDLKRLHDYTFYVEINQKGFKEFKDLFKKIGWFYSAMRSGINIKQPKKNDKNINEKDDKGIMIMVDVFYCKSILFKYFALQKPPIQWEKRQIKHEFFKDDLLTGNGKYYGLNSQIQRRKPDVKDNNLSPLTFTSKEVRLIKDLLGLSSEEEWQSYNNSTINKTEAINVNGQLVKKTKEDETKIVRYASPIQFKPIKNENGYTIYIKLNKVLITNKNFIIAKGHFPSFPLSTPKVFDLDDFFNFMLDKKRFKIENHIDSINLFKEKENEIYIFLEDLFNKKLKKIQEHE